MFSLFIKIVFLSHALLASPLEAYWGSISPGRGAGVLGHGFLLFKEEGMPFLLGDVYQYNVTIDSEKNLKIKNVNLTLKEEKFYLIVSYYTFIENRDVYLYKLNLSQQETLRLVELLKMDLNNPNFGPEHPYGWENNCVARPIELINQVVDSKRRIEFLDDRELFYSRVNGIQKTISDPILNRLPFYFSQTLENHPVSAGLATHYDRKTIFQARFLADALSQVDLMAANCHWDSSIKKATELYFALFLKTAGRLNLQPIIDLSRSCPESKPPLIRSLVDLYEALPPESNQGRGDIYKTIRDMGL